MEEEEPSVRVAWNYGGGHHAKDVFLPTIAPTITTGNNGLGTCIMEADMDEIGLRTEIILSKNRMKRYKEDGNRFGFKQEKRHLSRLYAKLRSIL